MAGAVSTPEHTPSAPATARRPNGKRETVLVVEDEPTLRQLAQRSLENAG
jgi:hypothetical protein